MPRRLVSVAVTAAVYAVVAAGAVVMVWPYLWMLSSGLKPPTEIFAIPPTIVPQQPTADNWQNVWVRVPLMSRYFLNSLVMSCLLVVGRLAIDALAAYSFARIEFPGRNALFVFFLTAMMVPSQALLVPQYVEISTIGWLNTYQGLVAPGLVDAFGIFMLRQFFLGIPGELEDAATIDGCGRLGVLLRIYLPLTVPALSTLGLFSFIAAWNSFVWPLLVATKAEWRTIEVGLALLAVSERMEWGLLMAASTMATLPLIAIFVVVQRQLIRQMSMAGVRH